jgi:hypothetical protein
VSASRTSRLLVRLYPAGWRERYGDELEALIVESSDGRRVPWRVRLDVMRAGARERLRAAKLNGDGTPGDQVRGGVLWVLCAWALFVVGLLGMEKFAEHWRETTPIGDRGVPSAASAVVVSAALVAGALVLMGVGFALPAVTAFLRAGGWAEIRRRLLSAGRLTGVAVAATAALVIWAGDLTPRQRDGHDVAYGIAFVVSALLVVACLAGWTAAAVATARRVRLSPRALRIEACIAIATTVAMAVMTGAGVVWWVAIAQAAPWFLAGRPAGQTGSALAAQMVVATVLMASASALAVAGSVRAIRAARNLAPGARPTSVP